MEHHELTIAALDSVAESSSNRRATDKLVTSPPNATGVYIQPAMDHNTIVDNTANAQEPSQPLLGTDMTVSAGGEGTEDQNSATLGLPSTSSNNSQSTIDVQDASTPPTSNSEGFSSQSTNQDVLMSQLSQLSQLAASQQPLTNSSAARPNITIAPTAGLKRTADGQVKQAHSNSPPSPQIRGHSRTTSGVSNASVASSRIGEVRYTIHSSVHVTDIAQISSELKARLSYAMVKVNNGWQSNSIDEVESMASQAGSPTSSTSTLHGRRNLITSPRAAIANIQGQTPTAPSNSSTPALSGDFDLYSRSDQPSRTYESFWRDHSTNLPSHRYSSHTSPPAPFSLKSLAPPADIRPTPASRRSGTPKFSRPPAMPGQGSNSPIHSPNPRTPNRGAYRENPAIQTPTQKTIQEQDAIETLMFMSSPGNSGNMKHNFPPRSQASPQQSPLRAEFNTQDRRRAHGKKVGFEIETTSGSTGSSEAGGAEYRSRTSWTKATANSRGREEAIDRLLEESEESSSDEETLVLNYQSPRRTIAAGRI
jgi:Whi5 like